MMKTLTAAFSFLTLFSLCFTSCKKDRGNQPENTLIGNWKELNLTGFHRSMKFTKGNTFHLSIEDGDGSSFMYSGTYQIEKDSLKVSTTEMLEQQPEKPLQTTATTYALYEKATYSISRDTLTLRYITYPADGPVPTTAKFVRMLAVDEGGR